MCLDRISRKANIDGVKRGYKVLVKANGKYYPPSYKRDVPLKHGPGECNEVSHPCRIYVGYKKSYESGYHVLKFKTHALKFFNSFYDGTVRVVEETGMDFGEYVKGVWGTKEISLCLCEVYVSQITAAGTQYVDKLQCYVAQRMEIGKEIRCLPFTC